MSDCKVKLYQFPVAGLGQQAPDYNEPPLPMKVRVKLRFNKKTGEMEEFRVDDQDLPYLSDAEHNREHDRIAAEIGNVLERHPQVTEILPGGASPAPETVPESPESESADKERQRR
ncbi:MAG: hypothetical protein H6970_04280 [Gammaproteobacteria bacterium]|nr:hypothetical protein [Gammaproteobacteria bacterium]MCP5424266.1 hypothetical protein [Gammaproteobacteria bacterium]